MNLLQKLQERHKSILDKMQAMLDETAESGMSDEQTKAYADLEAEADRVEKQIEAQKKLQERRSASVQMPENRDATGVVRDVATAGRVTVPKVEVRDNLNAAERLGLILWAMNRSRSAGAGDVPEILDGIGYARLAEGVRAARQRALSSGTATAGAEMVDQVLSREFIDFLRPQSLILRMGPRPIDISAGSVRVPGGNAGATASYRAEGADIAYTQVTLRDVTLSAKSLAAITAVNNELLSRSPLAVAAIVQTDLANAFREQMDRAGLRGDGTSNTPVGLLSAMAAGNKVTAAAGLAPSVATVESELMKLQLKLSAADIPVGRRFWLMSDRVFLYLEQLRDGNGNKAFPELAQGRLKMWPVLTSNIVPTNLGAGTNESEIYLVDADQFWLGDAEQMSIRISEDASYVQSSTVISAFARNQTVIRVIGAHDFALRYTTAAAVLQAVQWGA